MSPASLPSTSSEIDIDAVTRMFFRYWIWIGETLRSIACERSSGARVAGCACGTSGEGV
jgi:hypothetical protein